MELVNLPMTTFHSGAMGLNTNLEKNYSWLAFPGLIRAIVMLHCVVFALVTMKPEAAAFFQVTPAGMAKGEYWRLITWIFYPFVAPDDGVFQFINVIFLLIMMRISFLISDSLEDAWGETRTSFYVYGTLLCQTSVLAAAAFIGIPTGGLGTEVFYLALFFAFATLFPDFEFALFFVLPVKVWVLAVLAAVLLLFSSLKFPPLLIVYALCFLPYLVWALPRLRHWTKNRSEISARRVKFQSKAKSREAFALHQCAICRRTEQSDPDLEFRVAADDEEYCLDHLDDEGKPRPS
jgi:hypothetical protein